MVIKDSKKEDLKKIAECHQSAFPDSLSSKMGINYLIKMIEWYLSDDKKFLFHLEDSSGKCIGYCGGMIDDGLQPTGSASGMIQYSFNEGVKALMLRPWLLFHNELISKYKLIKKNVRMRLKKKDIVKTGNKIKKNNNKKTHEIQSGLVVIGVISEYHGKGCGTLLLQEFENKTKKMNISVMGLTVRNDNEKAIKSYERNGWIRNSLSGNSLEMIKRLN